MRLMDFLKYKRDSLGAKIFYFFTIFILVIFYSFTAFFIYYQIETMKDNLIENGTQLAGMLAYNSRLGVFAENKDLLDGPVKGIMQDQEVVMVQVFTIEGSELIGIAKNETAAKGILPDSDLKEMERIFNLLKKSRDDLYVEDSNEIEFWAPVTVSSHDRYAKEERLFFEDKVSSDSAEIIGAVRVILTTEMLDENISSILIKSNLMAVFFIVLGWMIVYLIVRGVTRPLNTLTEGVKEIETSGSFKKIDLETRDEFGRLAAAFNDMTESLKKRESEKLQLEEQLRHAQKMEAIGTLAGGIAHDFNNILTVIISYGKLLQKKIPEESTVKSYLNQMLSSAGRASALTQSLLAFSRKQIIAPKPINLNDVLSGIEDIFERIISEDIKLKVKLVDKDLIVIADRGQIEQVLMNLVVNARDAMPEGGDLTIAAKSVELDNRFFQTSGDSRPGKYAVISVSDTGFGIDGKIKDRIFDPFFTTKDVGEGTGLGLATVYGIVKQHDGYIDVCSEPGKGTTFKIYLPLRDRGVEKEELEAIPVLKGGTETVLVAEDNEDVRRLIKTILKSYGYMIIEAADGMEAIEKFNEYKNEVKLLLLDVVMPRKNGKDVYEEIRKTAPDIKALFISGYATEIMNIKNGAADKVKQDTTDVNFLPKPVSPDELVGKVRAILDK